MVDHPESEADDTLVAYVRGRLSPAAAAAIDAEAAIRPEVAAEVALMRGIVEVLDEDALTPAPGELGWARLSRAMDAEARTVAPPARARRPLWPLAASAAAAVLVWQVAAVPLLTGPEDRVGYAPVSEAPVAGFTLSVTFVPEATEGAVRALLRTVGGRISDGPSAIGLWQVSFASADARDAALEPLAASAIVASVQ